MADLSSLLTASKNLTSHLSRPDLPSVQLSLDQIEAQSRRLVSRLPPSDTDRAYVFSPSPLLLSNLLPKSNYLLAQARVDAPALSSSIAHLNTSTIFTPLQPLQDTDVAGFLRHAHEQNLISTIEEGRRETQDDFYRMLEDRAHRDWEAKKRRVFEELGGRVTADCRALVELKQSTHARSALTASVSPSITLQMQSKMMAYDRVVSELNSARLRGTSFPIVHALVEASLAVAPDVRFFLPMYIQLTKSLSQDQCE